LPFIFDEKNPAMQRSFAGSLHLSVNASASMRPRKTKRGTVRSFRFEIAARVTRAEGSENFMNVVWKSEIRRKRDRALLVPVNGGNIHAAFETMYVFFPLLGKKT